MQKCRDVAYLISSEGLEHASWTTQLLARLHLRYCKACRRYAAEVAKIGRIGGEAGRADQVDTKAVERLEGMILGYATDPYGKSEEEASEGESKM